MVVLYIFNLLRQVKEIKRVSSVCFVAPSVLRKSQGVSCTGEGSKVLPILLNRFVGCKSLDSKCSAASSAISAQQIVRKAIQQFACCRSI